ncbi:beta-defensin 125 [Tupaia chinensis]|uniref:beta-defensin 125 n=1 Tax=Tupaia chinensis TaxID=246437 RepID=UPI0003C8CD82|nr:beta-defensin 125 [Tupaia chinensis]
MGLPRAMLTFILCGLLTQVTKAGWEVKKCWKKNIGHCRQRCLNTERYIRLCRNKLSCCISLFTTEEYTRRPIPPLFQIEDITLTSDNSETFSGSPVSKLNDMVTFVRHTSTEEVTSEATSPFGEPSRLPMVTVD